MVREESHLSSATGLGLFVRDEPPSAPDHPCGRPRTTTALRKGQRHGTVHVRPSIEPDVRPRDDGRRPRGGPRPARSPHLQPVAASQPAHHAVEGGPGAVRPPPGAALDAQRGDVGALLLLRHARHPAVLHHRHRGEWRPRSERQLRPGHPGLLQRRRLPAGHPRGHLRRPRHRAVAVHPLRRRGHHGRAHLPDHPHHSDVLDGDRAGRRRNRLHQAEPDDHRRRPLRRR